MVRRGRTGRTGVCCALLERWVQGQLSSECLPDGTKAHQHQPTTGARRQAPDIAPQHDIHGRHHQSINQSTNRLFCGTKLRAWLSFEPPPALAAAAAAEGTAVEAAAGQAEPSGATAPTAGAAPGTDDGASPQDDGQAPGGGARGFLGLGRRRNRWVGRGAAGKGVGEETGRGGGWRLLEVLGSVGASRCSFVGSSSAVVFVGRFCLVISSSLDRFYLFFLYFICSLPHSCLFSQVIFVGGW